MWRRERQISFSTSENYNLVKIKCNWFLYPQFKTGATKRKIYYEKIREVRKTLEEEGPGVLTM